MKNKYSYLLIPSMCCVPLVTITTHDKVVRERACLDAVFSFGSRENRFQSKACSSLCMSP